MFFNAHNFGWKIIIFEIPPSYAANLWVLSLRWGCWNCVALGQQVFLNNAFIAFSKNSWGWKCGHDTVHGSWYNDNRYIHPWSTDWGTCGNDCWAYFSKVRTRLQQHWTAFLPGEIFSYSMPPSTDTFRFPNPNEADVESPEIKVHGTSFKWE